MYTIQIKIPSVNEFSDTQFSFDDKAEAEAFMVTMQNAATEIKLNYEFRLKPN